MHFWMNVQQDTSSPVRRDSGTLSSTIVAVALVDLLRLAPSSTAALRDTGGYTMARETLVTLALFELPLAAALLVAESELVAGES